MAKEMHQATQEGSERTESEQRVSSSSEQEDTMSPPNQQFEIQEQPRMFGESFGGNQGMQMQFS